MRGEDRMGKGERIERERKRIEGIMRGKKIKRERKVE